MTSAANEPSKGGQPQQDETGVGPVIDPTKNVLDLVKAESKYQDGMRDALEKLQGVRLEAAEKFQAAASSAERNRVDQLANLRQIYETRIADMLRTSVESTSTLVSTQLVQIQSTFNDRVSKLEQFRYESVGKSGVADPALADALARLGSGLISMQSTMTDAVAKMSMSIAALKESDAGTEGRRGGIGASFNWLSIAIGAFVGAGGLLVSILR